MGSTFFQEKLKRTSQKFTYGFAVTGLGLAFGLSIQFASAWTPPTLTPPAGNLAGPLNTSVIAQTKAGPLTVTGNILNNASTNGYLGLTGDLPGYPVNVYPTLKTNGYYLYFSTDDQYTAYLYTGGMVASAFRDFDGLGYYADPASVSIFNDMRANIYYDAQDTGYYIDPNLHSWTYNFGRYYGFNGLERDWNNSSYYVDPSATTNLNVLCINGVCNSSWPTMTEADTLQTVVNRGNTFTGSLVDANNNGYYLNPDVTSVFNDMRANIYYDAQDTGYYIDPNLHSWTYNFGRYYGFNGLERDWNNSTYYADPSDSSYFNYFGRNYGWNWTEYDWNDSTYYMDLNSVSVLNDLRVNIMYDRQNTGYYVDPNASSYMNNVQTSGWIQAGGYLYATQRVLQNEGHYIYPGSYSGLGAWQQSYYIASHATFGLYTNTGMFMQALSTQVFYDYTSAGDYTGYYVDPSATSSLNTVYASVFYYSDERLKKNVETIPSALASLEKLRGVKFQWKKDDAPNIGLIAQEVEKVYPEIVETDKNTGMKLVQYANLVGPIIEAVKELDKKIENALAVYQGLNKKLESQQLEIEAQRSLIEELQTELRALETR